MSWFGQLINWANVRIRGGTIENTAIGAEVPAAASFTSIITTDDVTVSGIVTLRAPATYLYLDGDQGVANSCNLILRPNSDSLGDFLSIIAFSGLHATNPNRYRITGVLGGNAKGQMQIADDGVTFRLGNVNVQDELSVDGTITTDTQYVVSNVAQTPHTGILSVRPNGGTQLQSVGGNLYLYVNSYDLIIAKTNGVAMQRLHNAEPSNGTDMTFDDMLAPYMSGSDLVFKTRDNSGTIRTHTIPAD
ncbi:hypothetical protein Pan216_30180 [Planctomycetes bacterium Pan216]|uniref:Uncharacterized protein n=1 Tax=Kolteria novifilia TaxID=2527975 RepID=A0A518B594_9BACT|nr:hypothetical protein Pan216_30180 [Planctomycetes bacterium Pan216]